MASVFTKYPCTRYHKDLAPEGREIKNAEKEAELGEGWVDTPAAFDPAYVPPTVDPPEGTPFESYVAPAAPPIAYPAMRYSRDGGERTIQGPGEEEAGWQDHPWTKDELAATVAPAAPPETDPVSPPGARSVHEADPPPPNAPPVLPDEGPKEDGLFSVPVPKVEEVVAEITDPAELNDIEAREQRNPRGARKGVLAAIAARRQGIKDLALQ